ncbi:MAG: cytochrome c [Flavobacteriales bacterium]|nr:cytochrome c [Flavobacteriales bacterium]
MKKAIFILIVLSSSLFIFSCGGDGNTNENNQEKTVEGGTEDYDPKRGEGKFSAENLVVGASIDVDMATKGEAISGTKCTSCHKLSEEKLVGPGWKGVTKKRELYWIMNFITNPDPMIEKDPEIQAQLELCLVRMPNQNLSDEEARSIVEFMRKNDEAK